MAKCSGLIFWKFTLLWNEISGRLDTMTATHSRATILLGLGLTALAQADLYEFTANLSYEQNGSNHDLRITMLGDGGLVEDPDNAGTEVFIFSGSGTLEYQFVPGLWFEIGNLSMGLSHWPFFSWPMGNYTQNDTLPPILPPSLESGSVDGVLTGTNISEGWDGQLLEGDWNALLRGTRTGTPRCKSTWKTGRLHWCQVRGGARTDPRGISFEQTQANQLIQAAGRSSAHICAGIGRPRCQPCPSSTPRSCSSCRADSDSMNSAMVRTPESRAIEVTA